MPLWIASIALTVTAFASDWPRFRGPNGNGVGKSKVLPVEFGPEKNVTWKTPLAPGHSSPVVWGDRIYLTGAEGGARADAGREKVRDEGGRLFTYCIDRRKGELLWRKEAPRPRLERYQPTNSPASPSAVTDGSNVYVFFGDYGLIGYTAEGREKWRVPLGPFNNVNGHGTSPILVEDKVILACDQDTESYLLALDKETGKVRWKTKRPESTRSYTTPGLYDRPGGKPEIILPGPYFLTSYDAGTGQKLWWVGGLSWQPKSTPIFEGDTIYAHWWEGGGEAETATDTPTFEETLKQYDSNGDRRISVNEFSKGDPKLRRSFENNDLGGDWILDEDEWNNYRARRSSRNRLIAVRPTGRGDRTDTDVLWGIQKFLPNCPTPLIYQGVLYLIKDGGILTTLDPKSGQILKQGRLTGALDTYYSSPVGGAGKVYIISQEGKAVVLKAGAQWEILAVNDLDDEVFATPAVLEDGLLVRTRSKLYKFAVR